MSDEPIPQALGKRVPTRLGEVWFDDVTDEDIEAIADYFTRPDTHLDTLLDRARMPDKAGLRERYAAWRGTGDPGQMQSVFALRLEGAGWSVSPISCAARRWRTIRTGTFLILLHGLAGFRLRSIQPGSTFTLACSPSSDWSTRPA